MEKASVRLSLHSCQDGSQVAHWRSMTSNPWATEAQLCSTLCDSMDYTVHGILQARLLKLGVLNPGLPHCRQILYPVAMLVSDESPSRLLETTFIPCLVAFPRFEHQQQQVRSLSCFPCLLFISVSSVYLSDPLSVFLFSFKGLL